MSHRYEQSRMADEAVVKEIALTFQRLDADKNGALSWEEFTTGVNALTTLQSLEA